MPEEKTHRAVKKPEITASHLADYMDGSQEARTFYCKELPFLSNSGSHSARPCRKPAVSQDFCASR